jgi:hypothetical protein
MIFGKRGTGSFQPKIIFAPNARTAPYRLRGRRHAGGIRQGAETGHQPRALPDLNFLTGHQLFGARDGGGIVVERELDAGDHRAPLFLEIVKTVLWHPSTPLRLIIPGALTRISAVCSESPVIHIP